MKATNTEVEQAVMSDEQREGLITLMSGLAGLDKLSPDEYDALIEHVGSLSLAGLDYKFYQGYYRGWVDAVQYCADYLQAHQETHSLRRSHS